MNGDNKKIMENNKKKGYWQRVFSLPGKWGEDSVHLLYVYLFTFVVVALFFIIFALGINAWGWFFLYIPWLFLVRMWWSF